MEGRSAVIDAAAGYRGTATVKSRVMSVADVTPAGRLIVNSPFVLGSAAFPLLVMA